MGLVGGLLGGLLLGGMMSGGGETQVVQQKAQTPAASAAPPLEAPNEVKKDKDELTQKRRGKKGLLVNPLDANVATNNTNDNGTGLRL